MNKLKSTLREKVNYRFNEMDFSLDNGDTITGFIASVEKPSGLKIKDVDKSVSVDLFVNGRLRELDILKHIKSNRVPESYLYGQINYNGLDDDIDRFTTSRESVKADDDKFRDFLSKLKPLLANIIDQWDSFRLINKEDGDVDNTKITKKERKSRELYNAVAKEYREKDSVIKDKINSWLNSLGNEAKCNFPAYADCFISENLVRYYIKYKKLSLNDECRNRASKYKENETKQKKEVGMNIDIRKSMDDINYVEMDLLCNLAEPASGGILSSLPNKAKEFKPIRNALMHTSLLTDEAKIKLTTILNEIKARLRNLLKRG